MILAAARHAAILTHVREHGSVRVTEIAPILNTSEATIRRDIDTLARGGYVHRVFGGATMPVPLSTYEPGFDRKLAMQVVEKEAIAKEALKLVQPGSAVGLSAGTTTWRLAHLLSAVPGITVITNSVQIANVFHPAGSALPNIHVILSGGERTPSGALVGPTALTAIHQFHLDTLFLGVHGMDDSSGFTTPNHNEAEANRALITAARRVVVLADHTKWGTVGMSTIAPLRMASTVISDSGLPKAARDTLREHVDDVRLVAIENN
jgi:DeoR family transcriptional regulator, fructose operon transcriptional repressor